ncbi:trypsin-like peptidase domain-containing protein (plasmid) [Sinorhizobium meliloti]
MELCLPISAQLTERPDLHSIGTAFFVRGHSGAIWLLTCAHLATKDTNYAALHRWPFVFSLHLPTRQTITLPLLTAGGEPRFTPVLTREGVMIDLVALSAGPVPSNVLDNITIYDLSAPHAAPASGEIIESFGFPHIEEVWPPQNPSVMQGRYLRRLATGAHEAEIGMIPGHSGGPVMTMAGQLIGMGIGQSDAYVDRIIPLDVIELVAT